MLPREFNRDITNLEPHQLIWLNTNTDQTSEDTKVSLTRFREVIDYTKIFTTSEECLNFIEKTKDTTTTFLVFSSNLDEQLFSEISTCKNVASIYIYCSDKDKHQYETMQCSKIKQVHTEIESLLNDLLQDVNTYLQAENHRLFTKEREGHSIGDPEQWWLHFITFLVYLPYPEGCRDRLITSLKNYYKDKQHELIQIEEFERTYHGKDAILWYTRDTFVYRLLNSALRRYDIELTFLFGFYLQDIYQQLKEEYERLICNAEDHSIIHAYRAQRMDQREIKNLDSGGRARPRIINNSFFSTSSSRAVALMYLNPNVQSTDIYQTVLFDIKMNIKKKSLPYADISHLSHFTEENEILFMPGTQFVPKKISYDENLKAWIIKLSLSEAEMKDEKDFQGMGFKQKLYTCTEIIKEITNLTLGEGAKVIFDELIALFPAEKWISALRFWNDGWYKEQWDRLRKHHRDGELQKNLEVISAYEHALQIWEEYSNDKELNTYYEIAELHSELAQYYYWRFDKNDRNVAQNHFHLAITNYQLVLGKNFRDDDKRNILNKLLRLCHFEIAITKDAQEKIETGKIATHYQQIKLQHLLDNSFHYDDEEIASCLITLAKFLTESREYDHALLNYEKALEIYIPKQDNLSQDVTSIYREMAIIYFKSKHDFNSALTYQLLSHQNIVRVPNGNSLVIRFLLNKHRGRLAESHVQLAEIYMALKRYDFATQHLNQAKQINEDGYSRYKLDITASYYEYFADIYIVRNQLQLANEYLQIAIEVYQKLKQQHTEEPDMFSYDKLRQEQSIEIDEMKISSIQEKLKSLNAHLINC